MKNISKTDILRFMLMMSCDIKYAFYQKGDTWNESH